MIVIPTDGPDYAGKTTFIAKLKAALEERCLKVVVENHPSENTETGKLIRRYILESRSNREIAELFVKAFRETTERVALDKTVDVLILDRYSPSTMVYQGDDGVEVVMASKLLQDGPPIDIMVAMDVDYNEALKRAKKRLEEQGKDWDSDVLTSRHIASEANWDALRARYKRAFDIHAKYVEEIVDGTDIDDIVSTVELMLLADNQLTL